MWSQVKDDQLSDWSDQVIDGQMMQKGDLIIKKSNHMDFCVLNKGSHEKYFENNTTKYEWHIEDETKLDRLTFKPAAPESPWSPAWPTAP